jgi:DNA-binding response OmpR family regulator
VLRVGSLELDPNRRLVTRAGHAVTLTAKEFAVLQFLMRHPEQVLSKAEILDNVWDQAFDGSDNIVEVYIAYLRRKLDTAFGVTSLETIRGMGYRLKPVDGGAPVPGISTRR